MTDEPQQPGAAFRMLRIFLPFVLGYFLSFAFRTVNAVISGQLTGELGLDATALGLLTASYFITFAAFQPVVGILLDRYGPRRVDAALLLLAAGGAALFAVGETLEQLAVGRALIGAGVSSALMASLTAIGQWWPRERLPMMNGLFVASGALGAVFATTPVQALLSITDWRGVFWGMTAATVAAAAVIWFVAPDRRGAHGAGVSFGQLLGGMARLLTGATFWRLAPALAFAQAISMAYISLWTGPWLRDVNGFAPPDVAIHLQWMALGMVAGSACFGLLAESLRRALGLAPLTIAIAGMFCALLVEILLAAHAPLPPAILWSAFSFFAGAPIMGYAIVTQQAPPELAGRANTALNLVVFSGSFALQSIIGAVIDLFPRVNAGYAPQGHAAALWGCVALEGAALAWLLLSPAGRGKKDT